MQGIYVINLAAYILIEKITFDLTFCKKQAFYWENLKNILYGRLVTDVYVETYC